LVHGRKKPSLSQAPPVSITARDFASDTRRSGHLNDKGGESASHIHDVTRPVPWYAGAQPIP